MTNIWNGWKYAGRGDPVFIGANDNTVGAVNSSTTFASWYADCDNTTPSSTCVA